MVSLTCVPRILSIHLTDKLCPYRPDCQMTPLTVITLHVWNCLSHTAATGRLLFDLCLVAFAYRTGSCLQLYLVGLALARSLYSQSLGSMLGAPGWCVWYCGFSADNSSATCLLLQRNLGAFLLFLLPGAPPLAHHTTASQGVCSLPLSTFAPWCDTSVPKGLLHFRISLWMIVFWHFTHLGCL